MDNYLFISIIIPTYSRATLLPLTINSFIDQSYPKSRYEIIIADNHSTDHTQAVLQDFCSQHQNIRSIKEDRQGVHYARNSAAKMALGEILYFSDDDMIADRFLLEELSKVFDLDPLIGSATGRIIGKFEVPPPAWVRKHLINCYLSLTEVGKPEELIVSCNDLVYSCHQAVRKDVFFACGGFNPENTAGVWVGDGETGLGIKIRNAGFKFAYTSKSVIYHMIPSSRMTLQYLVKRIGNQGYCDSCTEFRQHRTKEQIIPRLLRRNTTGAITLLLKTIANVMLGRESWHFLPARLMYLHMRNRYDFKLYRDGHFRSFVKIDDWINNDVIIKDYMLH